MHDPHCLVSLWNGVLVSAQNNWANIIEHDQEVPLSRSLSGNEKLRRHATSSWYCPQNNTILWYRESRSWLCDTWVEHCIDGLRESIMCAGDMTFIPVRWSKNRHWILPIFQTEHTCRDYNALKEWTRDRDAQNPKDLVLNSERYLRTGSFQKEHQ